MISPWLSIAGAALVATSIAGRLVTGRLRERLGQAFSDEHVFCDVASIGPGEPFAEAIRTAISAVDVVLVMIGPGWGSRRLDDEGDYVRMEITAALAGDKRIIPVLIDGTAMPGRDDLPSTFTR